MPKMILILSLSKDESVGGRPVKVRQSAAGRRR